MIRRSVESPLRVVGFDLDMTLVDSRGGVHASLLAVGKELGVNIDADAIVAELGPPMRMVFEGILPPDMVDRAVASYRRNVLDIGAPMTVALPGASDSLEFIDSGEFGGSSRVLTAKYRPLAIATLDGAGLKVDDVKGDLFAEQKASGMEGAVAYVGDHIGDVSAANTAGVLAIGVATGHHTAEQLWGAGADFVLGSLEELSDVLRQL